MDDRLKNLKKRMCKKCTIVLHMCNAGQGRNGSAMMKKLAKATGCSVRAYPGCLRAGITIGVDYKDCDPDGNITGSGSAGGIKKGKHKKGKQ